MMTRSAFSKMICLSAAVMVGQFGILNSTVDGQSGSSGPCAPMWEIYGINPYQPRVTSAPRFTSLQSQAAQPSPMCWAGAPLIENASVGSADEIFLCDVAGVDMTVTSSSIEFDPADPNPLDPNADRSTVIKGDVIKGDSSISSPSDIVITPPKSVEPTPDAIPSSEMKAELERARNEVKRLNVELSESRAKARISAERAYAAERAASAKGNKPK